MAKKTRRSKKEEEEFVALDELFAALSRKIDAIPVGKGKNAAITWGVISLLLIAVSSVLFHFNWVGTWVPALIGAPAGVLLYMIGLGVVKRTQLGEMDMFQMRDAHSFKQRLRRIALWFAIYAITFIPLGRYIPYGLGGAILVLLVMVSLTVGRRTQEELVWAKKGTPDPRDLIDAEEDAYEDAATEEDTVEADKIYYDEQRGGFGGKLK